VKIFLRVLLSLFALPLPLLADTTYTYTGQAFTSYRAPYTALSSVTGYITLGAALPANMSLLTQVTPVAFSFTDGIQTLTQANTVATTLFAVETDATGDIDEWLIGMEAADTSQIDTINAPEVSSLGANTVIDLAAINMPPASASNRNMAGYWTFPANAPPDMSPVPEPDSLVLAGTGLLGLLAAAGLRIARA
jgi:hypothetical protein